MSSTTDTDARTSDGLRCLEVWSDNAPAHNAVSVPGIDAWISSDPFEGDARGGDIHFVSMCGEGRVSRFAVVDVAGHGISVSRLGRRLRALMRKYIDTLDQTRFADAANRELLGMARGGRFATALLATYFAPTDHLIVCNAGHPRPLWYHAATGRWSLLRLEDSDDEAGNLPLGVQPTRYVQFAVPLDPGDIVLIYTDALIESPGPAGEPLGEQGLLNLVRKLEPRPPQDLNRDVLRAVHDARGGAPAGDDETLLLLHHNAADPPRDAASPVDEGGAARPANGAGGGWKSVAQMVGLSAA